MEQLPSGIAVADLEGCIVAMNRAFHVQLSCWPGCDELPVMESQSTVDRRAESTSGVLFSCQFVGDRAELIALVAGPL